MDDPRAIKRFVAPLGSFECTASDGTTGLLNASIEAERTYSLAGSVDEPVGLVLFWLGRRVERIDKGRYRTSDGLEITTDHPKAP